MSQSIYLNIVDKEVFLGANYDKMGGRGGGREVVKVIIKAGYMIPLVGVLL